MTGRQVYAYSSQTRDPTYGVSRGRSFSQQSYCVLFGPTKLIAQWWRIQELQKGGGARSRRGRIFRSGVCFDAPSHISYLFVARVVNKINNVNIVYWQKSKYMRVIQSNLQKQTRNFFSKRGGVSRRAGPGPAFVTVGYLYPFTHIKRAAKIKCLLM